MIAKNLANGTTTANAITSTAARPTVSGDLIFGAVMDDAGATTIAAGSGFTQRVAVNNKDLATEDLTQTTAGRSPPRRPSGPRIAIWRTWSRSKPLRRARQRGADRGDGGGRDALAGDRHDDQAERAG